MTQTSTTIRVRLDQRERLRRLAEDRSATMAETLDAALESLRREEFYAGMARAESDLRSNPAAWQGYLAERDEWLEPDLSGR